MEREKQNEKKKGEWVEQCPRHPKRGKQLDKGRLNMLASN
jgi:hypothetical protein